MKVVGLICEYNPFHNGHLYHLEAAKKATGADYVVVVMSGQFVQRGEPAIIDKWSRTKSALLCGADLVIELPVIFATSSAEFFAMASVSLLESLGVVDSFCFGSESGNITALDQVADILWAEPLKYKELLSEELKKGLNFPAAREASMIKYTTKNIASVLKTSNNILGIEYLKATKRIQSKMHPITIQRIGADYNDSSIHHQIASATAIRKALANQSDMSSIQAQVPDSTFQSFVNGLEKGFAPIYYKDFFTLIKYALLHKSTEEISQILDVTEGLENRLLSSIKNAKSLNEFFEKVGTKRYTNTKLQRAILHIILNITKEDFLRYTINGYVQYIRILGFKTSAQPLLKAIKDNATIPLVVNVSHGMNNLTSLQKMMLEAEIYATELYNTIVFDKYRTHPRNDYTQQIIKIM